MKQCPICNSKFCNFLPLPVEFYKTLNKMNCEYSLDSFETLNCAQYICPNCSASDRERLMALFIQKEIPLSKDKKVLEIAPSKPLIKFFKSYPASYRSADLSSALAQDKVDITNMHQYENNSFDLILCSHVLEHVPDDGKAIRELCRVLKPGGTLLALVPIPLGLEKTDEDPGLKDAEKRWKRFGQDDHIRMYSKADFLTRLAINGFEIEQIGINQLGSELFSTAGIAPGSILYACKPAIQDKH